jgi:hypothetical protein
MLDLQLENTINLIKNIKLKTQEKITVVLYLLYFCVYFFLIFNLYSKDLFVLLLSLSFPLLGLNPDSDFTIFSLHQRLKQIWFKSVFQKQFLSL